MRLLNCRGFTLIEVMMSITLLSIGLLAVTSVIVSSGKTSRRSAITDECVFLSQEKLADMALRSHIDNVVKEVGRFTINPNETELKGTTAKLYILSIEDKHNNKKYIETFYLKR